MAASQQWRLAAIIVAAILAATSIGSAIANDKDDCKYDNDCEKPGYYGYCEHGKCKYDKHKCKYDKDCVEKPGYYVTCEKYKCVYTDKCKDVKCPPYYNAIGSCYDGKCVYTCKDGYANCNDKWEDGCEVDLYNNVKNCGYCGVPCKEYRNTYVTCKYGKCEYTCKHGYANCNGKWEDGCEVYLYSDVKNCGKCDYKCKDYYKCYDGKCVYSG